MSIAVAFGIALGLIPAARRAGFAVGLVDRPGDPTLAIHVRPVPVLGGPAVVASTFGATALLGDAPAGTVAGAVAIALVAGVVDDVRPLPPAARVALMAVAGLLLVGGGASLSPLGPLGEIALIALVVVCANATNLLDGQNGLVGGLGAVSALGLAWLSPAGSGSRALGLALAGALAAFLAWNMPGRIFLGNGGAYALGTLLAALTADVAAREGWRGVIAAGACLGVFAFEIVFTVARRVGQRTSITGGDRLHSYDLLAARTGSRPQVTWLFTAGGAAASGIGRAASELPLAGSIALVGGAAIASAVWGMRLWAGREHVGT